MRVPTKEVIKSRPVSTTPIDTIDISEDIHKQVAYNIALAASS